MILAATIVFFVASFAVVYPYIVYPVVLRLLTGIGRKYVDPHDDNVKGLPYVTLIVSAYNEQTVISKKVHNALSLDYPEDRLEVLVVSDESSDGTDEIVLEIAAQSDRVHLLRQSQRHGKSAGLNNAIAIARGDIVVFSDANALYEPNSIRELVRHFADAQVGYVVGAALYSDSKGNRASESEGIYWKLELFLKQLESDYSSVVGGDGAIYAIRRKLFRPLKDDDISDFVNPLQIIASGFRGVFNANAQCYEDAGETFHKEFMRKRRIVNRSWRAVVRYRGLLNCRQHGRYIFMVASHKVIRWFALPFVAIAWIANSVLLGESPFFVATWTTITSSIVLAVIGFILDRAGMSQPKMVSVFYYFYLVSVAGLLGIWDEFRGIRHATWDHIRGNKS